MGEIANRPNRDLFLGRKFARNEVGNACRWSGWETVMISSSGGYG